MKTCSVLYFKGRVPVFKGPGPFLNTFRLFYLKAAGVYLKASSVLYFKASVPVFRGSGAQAFKQKRRSGL